MAEKQSKEAKRRVRNPETFRERAIKAAETGETTTRQRRIKSYVATKTRTAVQPLAGPTKKFASFKPVRKTGKVLRFLGKILFISYIINSWRELRLVQWPGWKESRRLTYAVLSFAIVFGASIATVDYGLDKLFKNILLK